MHHLLHTTREELAQDLKNPSLVAARLVHLLQHRLFEHLSEGALRCDGYAAEQCAPSGLSWALVQVCAALPHNFIAFEYPAGDPAWWYDIVEGLPDPIVRDGMIDVWDRPGMGVDIVPERAKRYLLDEDKNFFD